MDDKISRLRKSHSRLVTAAQDKVDSTRFASHGPRKELEVRDASTRILHSTSDTAMRLVDAGHADRKGQRAGQLDGEGKKTDQHQTLVYATLRSKLCK